MSKHQDIMQDRDDEIHHTLKWVLIVGGIVLGSAGIIFSAIFFPCYYLIPYVELSVPSSSIIIDYGDQIDLTGFSASKKTRGGKNDPIEINSSMISYDPSYIGTQTATFSCEGVSTDFVLTINKKVIDTPVVSYDQNRIYWTAIDNASSYQVDLGGVYISSKTCEYSFSNLTSGSFTASVRAIPSDGDYYENSLWSGAISLTKLTSVSGIGYNGTNFYWNGVEGAASYTIAYNDETYSSQSPTFTASLKEGENSIIITPIGSGNLVAGDSVSRSFTKLGKASNLIYQNNSISWNEVEGASSYSLSIDGGEYVNCTSNSYSLTGVEEGSHSFTIIANGDNQTTFSSDSYTGDFSITRLDTPSITSSLNSNYSALDITLSQVSGADTYSLVAIVNNGAETKTTEYDLSTTRALSIALDDSMTSISIYASCGDSNKYLLDSHVTETITYDRLANSLTGVSYSDGRFDWDEVSGSSYYVTIDGETRLVTNNYLSYPSLEAGDHSISIRQIRAGYLPSLATSWDFEKLASVTNISYKDGTISWDGNSLGSYAISINNGSSVTNYETSGSTSYTLESKLGVGNYSISVIQKSKNNNEIDSDSFTSDSFSIKQLADPVITSSFSSDYSTLNISLNSVEGADIYSLTIATNLGSETVDISSSLSYAYSLSSSISQISLTATCSSSLGYSLSGYSSEVAFSRFTSVSGLSYSSASSSIIWDALEGATSYVVKVDDTTYTATSPSLPTSYLSSGNHTITVSAICAGYLPSFETSLVVTKLSPVSDIEYNNGTISWTSSGGSNSFKVIVDNTEYEVSNATSYELPSLLGAGSHSISVIQVGVSDNQIDSESTYAFESETFTVTQLATPLVSASLASDYSSLYIAVSEVSNANTYSLTVNTSKGGTDSVAETYDISSSRSYSFPLNEDIDKVSFSVTVSNSNGLCLNATSTLTSFSRLSSITSLAYKDGVISWDSVANANSYILSIDGTSYTVNGQTSYEYTPSTVGSHAVSIYAIRAGYLPSLTSSISINKFSAVSDISYTDNTISWSSNNTTGSFEVTVDGTSYTVSGATSLELSEALGGGDHTISVKQIAVNDNEHDSGATTYSFSRLESPTATLAKYSDGTTRYSLQVVGVDNADQYNVTYTFIDTSGVETSKTLEATRTTSGVTWGSGTRINNFTYIINVSSNTDAVTLTVSIVAIDTTGSYYQALPFTVSLTL